MEKRIMSDDIDWIPLEENEESKRFREWVEYLKQLIIKYTIMENKVKIPASHLRAGNLHLSQKLSIPILQMFSVEIDRVSFSSITAYGISLVETGIIDFNPIRLTHEWLKKFGLDVTADPSGDPGDCFWKKDKFTIYCYDSRSFKYPTVNHGEFISLLWVHELQNLYFSLYRKELELIGLDSKK